MANVLTNLSQLAEGRILLCDPDRKIMEAIVTQVSFFLRKAELVQNICALITYYFGCAIQFFIFLVVLHLDLFSA